MLGVLSPTVPRRGMLGVLYLLLCYHGRHAGCTIPPAMIPWEACWVYYTSVFGRKMDITRRAIPPSLGERCA